MVDNLMKLPFAIIALALLSSSLTAQHNNTDIYTNHEMDIYAKRSFKKSNGRKVAFIPLSYPGWAIDQAFERDDDPTTYEPIWRVHKDSAVIPDKYLGETEVNRETRNYHKLTPEHRRLFLRRRGIAPDDSIFYYHVLSDSLLRYSVQNLPLIAKLSFYMNEPPVRETAYQVGFEIQNLPLDKNSRNEFIYIGQKNPFVRGEVQFMDWKSISVKRFPSNWEQIKRTLADHKHFRDGKPGDAYLFTTSDYQYYVRNLLEDKAHKEGKEAYGRYLIVTDSERDTVVYKRPYYQIEGRYLQPLNNATDYKYQWTGRLFKNKPPVIHGFYSVSFGCPSLDFLDPSVPPIYINCDNRH